MKNITLLFFLLTLPLLNAQKLTNQRALWFTDARFGMFIHWGVYSGAEGYWKGEKLRYDNDYAEWIKYRNQISNAEYLSLLDNFDWDSIDPEEWVLLAKKAGMKYVTITAKHHDGFGLWNSKASDYNIYKQTNAKRDIIKELAEACKKHGLKLGLYYSHWIDWEHPDSWDHSKEITGLSKETYSRYWEQKVMPQMRELLTDYGEIGLIWFDMWIHHSETVVTKEQLLRLKKMIRELQPNCLINSRLGLSVEEDRDVDFQTLDDNQLGYAKKEHPFQTSATVAHSWGYHATDSKWKSTTTLLKSIIGNVALNGNLMLNIGPRANGEIPKDIEQRIEEIGEWLKVNGESIYGSAAFGLRADMHDWGKLTYNEDTSKLYLHIYNWPLNNQLKLTGVKNNPIRIYQLADKSKAELEFNHHEAVTSIKLPKTAPDLRVSVLVIEYNATPTVENDLVAYSFSGGYSLKPNNAIRSKGDASIIEAQKFGSIPEHVQFDQESEFQWKIYIDEPGQYNVDISYSSQEKSANSKVTIVCNGSALKAKVQPTGKTVGEPNTDWHIDRYVAQKMGTFEFARPGYYTLTMTAEPDKDKPIKFQWLWLEKVKN